MIDELEENRGEILGDKKRDSINLPILIKDKIVVSFRPLFCFSVLSITHRKLFSPKQFCVVFQIHCTAVSVYSILIYRLKHIPAYENVSKYFRVYGS